MQKFLFVLVLALSTLSAAQAAPLQLRPGQSMSIDYNVVSQYGGRVDVYCGNGYNPPPVGRWVYCAQEDGVCQLPGWGTYQVRYGLNGRYAYRNAQGNIGCNNNVFGDPAYGDDKICEYYDPNAR